MAELQIDRLLETCIKRGASDLHLHVGRPPTLRLHGRLRPLETKVLGPEDTVRLMEAITPVRCQQELQEQGGTDFGFEFGDAGRFRTAVFQQRGNISLTPRLIPTKLLTFDEIGLPSISKRLCRRPRGMFLVTGRCLAGLAECQALRIEMAERYLATESSGRAQTGLFNPWDEYELQEIPITNVPKGFAGGHWDNIILNGDQLILLWQTMNVCYVGTVPISGGDLRIVSRVEATDPIESPLMRPIHWAAMLGDTLYVARSWGGYESDAAERVLEGKLPVPDDWPTLLAVKDGEIIGRYSEATGLPGRSINTMAVMDGKIYLGMDNRRLLVTRSKGAEGFLDLSIRFKPGALVCFDPATESFDVIASSRRVAAKTPLDGGGPWGVTHIRPDAAGRGPKCRPGRDFAKLTPLGDGITSEGPATSVSAAWHEGQLAWSLTFDISLN